VSLETREMARNLLRILVGAPSCLNTRSPDCKHPPRRGEFSRLSQRPTNRNAICLNEVDGRDFVILLGVVAEGTVELNERRRPMSMLSETTDSEDEGPPR
jgi:hypothetical protein